MGRKNERKYLNMAVNKKIVLHDANVGYNGRNGVRSYRNFAGEGTLYNAAGNRNFVVFLDTEKAKAMEAEGWPIKWKQDSRQDHDGEVRAQLKVNVKYRTRDGRPMKPPKIVVITSNNRTEYGENEVGNLDFAQFRKCDIQLSMYKSVDPRSHEEVTGVALDTMFVTLEEDELTEEYNALWANNDNLPF